MKVAIVLSNRWNSAITEYALSAARGLKTRGHEVFMILRGGSPSTRRAADYQIRSHALTAFSWAELFSLRRILRDEAPSHILTCAGIEESLCSLACGSVPLFRFRGHQDGKVGFVARMGASLQSRKTRATIFVSKIMEENGRALLPRQRFEVIPLGIDTERFQRRPEEPRSGDLVIFGRFDLVKGHRHFMGIFADALKTLMVPGAPKVRLHIVGQSANISAEQLLSDATEAGLVPGENLILTEEWIEDPTKLLSGALMGVIPSLGSEVICRVAEEFLVCGAPIFVSGAGSLDEMIMERSGWTYRGLDGNRASLMLCRAIETAWNESLRAREERARSARELFSLDAMGRNLEAVLTK